MTKGSNQVAETPRMDPSHLCVVKRRRVYSAKGQAFISEPGATPQGFVGTKAPSAESTTHFLWSEMNCAFSACLRGQSNAWGDTPG